MTLSLLTSIRPTSRNACAGLGILLLAGLTASIGAWGRPSYDMDLSVDCEMGAYAGEIIVTTENPTELPLDRLIFRLFPNDQVIYAGASLAVQGATQGNISLELKLEDDPTILTIPLLEPLGPGQTASLTLRFKGSVGPSPARTSARSSGYGILTKNDSSLVLTSFYPLLAPFDGSSQVVHPVCEYGDTLWSDAADYTVQLTADSGFLPASTGRLTSSTPLGSIMLHDFQADGARDFALVLTSGLAEVELQSGSRTLRAWFSPMRPEAAAQALTLASSAADLFTDLIGPLPFDEIELIEVPLRHAIGVEFSGLILLSADYSAGWRQDIYSILVSHEMAHQWFYAAVGNDPVSEAWLDESLATFLSNIFLDHIGRTASASREQELWITGYVYAQQDDPRARIGMPSCDFDSSSTYSSHVYGGGAYFLQTLRNQVGDEVFFDALQAYYAAHIGRICTTDALLAAFKNACECDLSEIFASFGFAVSD